MIPTPPFRIYAACMAGLYVTIVTLKLLVGRDGADWIIPLYGLGAFLYSLGGEGRGLPALRAALLFALAGDICINLTPLREGAAVFCLTHICLTAFYLRLQPIRTRDGLYALPFLLVGPIYCAAALTAAPRHMAILLPAYVALVSLMAWRAVCIRDKRLGPVLIAGSLLFYATDLSVLADVVHHERIFSLITWLLYPPALFLLSLAGNPKQLGRNGTSP